MSDSTTWVGMDVHKENIVTVSISGDSGTVMTRWETPNTAKGKERLAAHLAGLGKARCVYEAGPCGYDLRRFLDGKGIPCDVIAPSLIPTKPGDRIKTDRRDAEKLARMHRLGELTAICVPTPAQEALRDLVRAAREHRNALYTRRTTRLRVQAARDSVLPLQLYPPGTAVGTARHDLTSGRANGLELSCPAEAGGLIRIVRPDSGLSKWPRSLSPPGQLQRVVRPPQAHLSWFLRGG